MGNKDDAPERKQVDPQDAKRFADQMGIQLFETSAKENKNVEEVMLCLNEQVYKNWIKRKSMIKVRLRF